MICKVLVSHSTLDEKRLETQLYEQFRSNALSAADWKSKSAKYKTLPGMESKLIWGSETDESLYGLLRETPRRTLIWIEDSGSKDWVFTKFRGILDNFATALMKSQRGVGRITRSLTVKDSNLYVESDRDSLGVTVRILKEAQKVPQITLKEMFLSGVVAVFALIAHYQNSNKSALDYLAEVQVWSLPIPIYGWFAIVLFGIIVGALRIVKREVEVKFDA
jgi:hypothetical protein